MAAKAKSEKRWQYGDAGDRWSVQTGDVWQAGDHVMACVDVESDAARAFYAEQGRTDLVYVDPPWDTGNARTFRTKAGLEWNDVTVDRLWARILDLVLPHLDGDLYVEIGKRHHADAEAWIRARRPAAIDAWPILYYRKHPCWLLRSPGRVDAAGALVPLDPAHDSPAGLDDEQTPTWAIRASSHRGDVVCDPCMGRGLTLVAAEREGRHFLGTELHPRRLAVAFDRVAALGLMPTKIGTL